MKPRLLDLFCGAGGAAMGYHRAGFEVVGVDIKPQPRYPFEFIQADVTRMFGETSDYLLNDPTFRGFPDWEVPYRATGFDAIHASPPCQKFSSLTRVHGREHPDLIGPTRELLMATGLPWVIENVPGAPLIEPLVLCGSMFGLGALCRDGRWRQLRRHRLFEMAAFGFLAPCAHIGEPLGVYGNGGGQAKTVWSGGRNRGYMGTRPERREAMGIDWMTNDELSQAIPPAYTEWIGRHLMAHLEGNA